MFTGLIETIATVKTIQSYGQGARLTVKVSLPIASEIKYGDSVSVNGTCLTANRITGAEITFDVSGQSLNATTLKNLKPAQEVNIERAMRADARFGGHFVQGHIDTVGRVEKIENKGQFWKFTFGADKITADYLIEKGSVAVDGVSLTIAQADGEKFSVAVIPATYQCTIFKNYKVGSSVNIETDIICRTIKSQLEKIISSGTNITIDKLKSFGF